MTHHFYAIGYEPPDQLVGTCQHPEHQDELCPLHEKLPSCVGWRKRR